DAPARSVVSRYEHGGYAYCARDPGAAGGGAQRAGGNQAQAARPFYGGVPAARRRQSGARHQGGHGSGVRRLPDVRLARATGRPAARNQVPCLRISWRDRVVGDRVRRLVVGAAIIVAACGGPPETPVPVAAPGSAGAAAPAPIRPFLESHEQYYDIEGSPTGALREQMHRLGPRAGGAAR